MIPRAEERQFVQAGVDKGEIERIEQRIAAADMERAGDLRQALAIESC